MFDSLWKLLNETVVMRTFILCSQIELDINNIFLMENSSFKVKKDNIILHRYIVLMSAQMVISSVSVLLNPLDVSVAYSLVLQGLLPS